MLIRRIKISNFKSFKDLEIAFDNFNVLVGANASGKSNLVGLFKLIRDIKFYGLEKGIAMQGRFEYLRNINIKAAPISIELEIDTDMRKIVEKKEIGMRINRATYKFIIENVKKNLKIMEDSVEYKCSFIKLKRINGQLKEKSELGDGTLILSTNTNREVKKELITKLITNIKELSDEDIISSIQCPTTMPNNVLLMNIEDFLFWGNRNVWNISYYNFLPQSAKRPSSLMINALVEDGSNLAVILKYILENQADKRKFFNLVKDCLPFVEKLNVESLLDNSLLLQVSETYSKAKYLPANLMSDGTLNILALIIALYFDISPVTVIEEPERNIHPYLISKIIEMMKEVSQKRQIIITTHSPEVVKCAGIENLLFLSRDKNGFSVISKPNEKKEVQIFLENEMGLDELFMQNLLEIGI